MATTVASTSPGIVRVPSGRLDRLWSGSGVRSYIRTNKEALKKIGDGFEEAADLLFRELKKVPPMDARFQGSVAARPLNFADHRIALRRMRDHLRAAAMYQEEASRHLSAAWSVYLGLYGDPDARPPGQQRPKFKPDK